MYFYRLFQKSEWMRHAACAGHPTEWWFPPDVKAKGADASTIIKNARRARRICWTCPVQTECLDYALDNREQYGIWGGLGIRERYRILRSR